jgi:hypothetical protein
VNRVKGKRGRRKKLLRKVTRDRRKSHGGKRVERERRKKQLWEERKIERSKK